jgi:hypothetical protein
MSKGVSGAIAIGALGLLLWKYLGGGASSGIGTSGSGGTTTRDNYGYVNNNPQNQGGISVEKASTLSQHGINPTFNGAIVATQPLNIMVGSQSIARTNEMQSFFGASSMGVSEVKVPAIQDKNTYGGVVTYFGAGGVINNKPVQVNSIGQGTIFLQTNSVTGKQSDQYGNTWTNEEIKKSGAQVINY